MKKQTLINLLLVVLTITAYSQTDPIFHISADKGFVDLAGGKSIVNMGNVSIEQTPWGGKSFLFNGNNYLEVADEDDLLDFVDHFTIEMVIRTNVSQDGIILSKGGLDTYPKNLILGLMTSDNGGNWFSWGVEGGTASGPVNQLGVYEKVVFIFKSDSIFYVSGSMDYGSWLHYPGLTDQFKTQLSDDPLRIGAGFSTAPDPIQTRYYDGEVVEVKIYNRALDPSEITPFEEPTDAEIIQGVFAKDYNALVAFYIATDGPNWTDNSGWLEPEVPVSEWHGITTTNNRVTHLHLSNNNLNGVLSDSLGLLDNLNELVLFDNHLDSSINVVTLLQNLRKLNLANNNFTGNIPSEIGNLTNLEFLELGFNQLTGEIPEQIGLLSNLRELYLEVNLLSGTFPTQIWNLINLMVIRIENNQINGTIPPDIQNLVSLTYFDIRNNLFEGSIPIELGNLIHLTYLGLSNNNLTGIIPSSLNNLNELWNIQLSQNDLEGDFSLDFSNFPNLVDFYIRDNNISGIISSEICNLAKLNMVDFAGNNFTSESCQSIKCLIEKNVLFGDENQIQRDGFSLINDCNSSEPIMLADFPFNGDALDHSGNNYNGVLYGGVSSAIGHCGDADGAFRFDRTDDFIEIPSTSLKNLTRGSLEISLKLEEMNSDHWFLCYGLDAGSGISMCVDGSGALCYMLNGTAGEVTRGTSGKITTGEWYHIVLTWDGSYVRTYINGQMDIQWTRSDYPGDVDFPLVVGTDSYFRPTYMFSGSIDHLRIYEGALNTDTITRNYNNFASCLPDDKDALIAFYNATDGPNWTNNSGWLEPDVPISEWYGIHVNEGRVTSIELWNNNLNGFIPDEFYNLTGLVEFLFHGNPNLGGEISPLIGNLINLHGIHSNETNFSGTIPSEIGNCLNLNTLHIEYNNLEGALPIELCSLPIQDANFAGNNFSSESCPTMECLVQNNVNFHSDAWQRQKDGFSLFEGCGILPRVEPVLESDSLALVTLYIATHGDNWHNHENWLTEMPVAFWHGVEAWDGRVREINLCGNNLDGTIPPEFYNLSGLQGFALCENNLTGEILPEIGNLAELHGINLNGNHLEGTLPQNIGNCVNLWDLHLGWNNFTGAIPESLCSTNVGEINLHQNNFDVANSCAAVQCLVDKKVNFHVDIWQTQQSGLSLFKECGLLPPFQPVIPQDSLALVALYQATDGDNWYNNDYWLSEIPVSLWHGVWVLGERVRDLSLVGNNLNGEIPEEFYNLTGIRAIGLHENNLSGSLNSLIGNLSELSHLNLAGNQLSGAIPSEIGLCLNLSQVHLPENNFTELPIEICNLPLNEVNLSRNYFGVESCDAFQCLIDLGLSGPDQPQKNGFIFPTYCNPNINRSLIISEARLGHRDEAYVEITNIGNDFVSLNNFEFGCITPWREPWNPDYDRHFMLPEHILAPGESFLIAAVNDFGPEQWLIDPDNYLERQTKEEWFNLADIQIHVPEANGDHSDSIIGDYWRTFDVYNGRDTWYIRHHLSETESVVIDQVGGVFDNDGRNQPFVTGGGYDVAGFPEATRTATLVRKANVTAGNLDFANGRGVGPDDSEWIALPHLNGNMEPWRDVFWTAGNHGDYNLNETSLVSSTLSVDWINKTITAPWGTRGLDDFMNEFEKTPGLAWHYHLSENVEDSAFMSARTGDQITIYACGNDMDMETFEIIVLPPDEDDNIVIPKYRLEPGAEFFYGFGPDVQAGQVDWPRVTQNAAVMDTITGSHFGLPFATRTDTLVKYLEFPANATYEFIFSGGYLRADLTTGDMLRVTAENGTIKDYFIQVQPYRPKHDAQLAALTWPGIPEDLRGAEGWKGDTIPGFSSHIYEYTVNIPFTFEGIPVLVPVSNDLSAKISTAVYNPDRGNIENKTLVYTVIAEDGYTTRQYAVHLNKLKDPAYIQPYLAKPFLSEFIFWDQWSNSFGEICNPGTVPLVLSNYMIAMDWIDNPADMIAETNEGNWLNRFDKYIPGFKWKSEEEWNGSEYIAVPDPEVNPVIQPGDVFCFGAIYSDAFAAPAWLPDYVWPVPAKLDVQFNNFNGIKTYLNPWGEAVSGNGSPIRKWMNSNWYLFEIKNDSVKQGLKAATDPDDFELIEAWGMGEATNWMIGGQQAQMITNWMRKPEVYKPNPEWGTQGSFGDNPDDCEWTSTNRTYWQSLNVGWPLEILNIGNNLGEHIINEVTEYQSVIYSNHYKVSKGYSMNETIQGVITGTTSAELLSLIIKADEGQKLTIIGLENDSFAGGEILEVISADGSNSTRYYIEVSAEGLSSDAILTSEAWEISFPADTAEITGFEYGTTLQTVVDSIVVPYGATMVIYDENQNLVPYQKLNKQGQMVNVTVNAKTWFEVTAEDKQTIIVYRLVPSFPEDEIVATSDYFYVNNEDSVIGSILPSTTVAELLANIYVEDGATAIVVDKYGFERTQGELYPDDQVVIIYNWDAYYSLKTGNEDPRTFKTYRIYMCETLPVVRTKDIAIELDEYGYASITVADIDNGSTNECGESWLTLSQTEFDCSNIGLNTVKLSMQNDLGGIASYDAAVTVTDNILPVVIADDVVDINADGSCEAFTNIWDYIRITDNCGIQSMVNDAPEVMPLGTTLVTWNIVDYGGNEVTVTQSITINNYEPEIVEIIAPVDPVDIINEIHLSAVVDDNNLASATWDWGDSTKTDGVINGDVYGSHTYAQPGVYTIKLSVTDMCGKSDSLDYRYIVIYDPEGGFVTGGGWIISPLGASVQYPDSTGKANFGFVSKYKKGANVPTGNTEFKFKAGDLSYKSSVYEWLVIAGSKAKFKGIGTINGTGDYGFMISAIDGDLKQNGDPDMFRIKIWDAVTDAVVYDNQMGVEETEDPTTSISGGSIVIHDPNEKSAEIGQIKSDNFKNLKIYPNPVDEKLIVSGIETSVKSDLRLIDITGKIIWMNTNRAENVEIDMSGFASGIYSLLIISNDEFKSIKVIKK